MNRNFFLVLAMLLAILQSFVSTAQPTYEIVMNPSPWNVIWGNWFLGPEVPTTGTRWLQMQLLDNADGTLTLEIQKTNEVEEQIIICDAAIVFYRIDGSVTPLVVFEYDASSCEEESFSFVIEQSYLHNNGMEQYMAIVFPNGYSCQNNEELCVGADGETVADIYGGIEGNGHNFGVWEITVVEGGDEYIDIVSPVTNSIWSTEETYEILWTDNITSNVKIKLYDEGYLVETITSSTASDGSYSFLVPSYLPTSDQYQIGITSLDNGSVYDMSPTFTISAEPFITITNPDINDTWHTGSQYAISWEDNITSNIKIKLYKGGNLETTIATSTPSDGTFLWTISESEVYGTDYQIKIQNVEGPSIDAWSEEFTIYQEDFIDVTSPTNSSNWQVETTHTIEWISNLSGNVKIRLYKNDLIIGIIADEVPNNGEFVWEIPLDLISSNTYQIRVQSRDNTNISGYSEEFTITFPYNIPNDDPCDASILDINSHLVYTEINNMGATHSGVPNPDCGSYESGHIFGDGWCSFTVPNSGEIIVFFDTIPGEPEDWVAAAYTGSCNDLTMIACNDDSGPSTMPELVLSELTPGETIFVRYWEYNNDNAGYLNISIVDASLFYQIRASDLQIVPNPLQQDEPAIIAVLFTNDGPGDFVGTLFLSWHDQDGEYITDLASSMGLIAGESQMLYRPQAPIVSDSGYYQVLAKIYDPDLDQYFTLDMEEVRVQGLQVQGDSVPDANTGESIDFQSSISFEDGVNPVDIVAELTLTYPDGTEDTLTMNFIPDKNYVGIAQYKTSIQIFDPGDYLLRFFAENQYGAKFADQNIYTFTTEETNQFREQLTEIFEETGAYYSVPTVLLKAIAWYESEWEFESGSLGNSRFGIMSVDPRALNGITTDDDLELLAGYLKNGTTSFPDGWTEYQSMEIPDIIALIIGLDFTGEYDDEFKLAAMRANIRAGALMLRFYAHADSRLMNFEWNSLTQQYETDYNFPVEALESWWFVVTCYGTILEQNQILTQTQLMRSNYPFRIYNILMSGVYELFDPIPITLPPHINFAVAEEGDDIEVEDQSLIPTTPVNAAFVRVTLPFLPWRDLRILHDDFGDLVLVTIPEELQELPQYQDFEAEFIFHNVSADNAQINAYFDYSYPNTNLVKDGWMVNRFGQVDISPYDGHPANDYQARVDNTVTNRYEWYLQYPVATGNVRVIGGTYGIYELRLMNGYRVWYVHSFCINPELGTEVEIIELNDYFVTTGDIGTEDEYGNLHPHAHIQFERCISNDPADWNNPFTDWIPIDSYGWQGNNDSEGTLWTRAEFSRLWSTETRIIPDPSRPDDGCANPNINLQADSEITTALTDESIEVLIDVVNFTQEDYDGMLRAILYGQEKTTTDCFVIDSVSCTIFVGEVFEASFFSDNLEMLNGGNYLLQIEFLTDTSWVLIDDGYYENQEEIIIPDQTTVGDISQSFKVFPNPTTNILHIETNANFCSVVLIDRLGRVIKKETFENRTTISVTCFLPGLYILKLMFDGQVFHVPIVIE